MTKDKRQFGYFTLPVLIGDDMVAALDLKTDRAAGKLLIQSWHWLGGGPAAYPQEADRGSADRFANIPVRRLTQKTNNGAARAPLPESGVVGAAVTGNGSAPCRGLR